MPSHKQYSMSSAKHAKLTKTKKKALENKKLTLTEQEYHEIAHIFKSPDSPDSQDLVRELFSDEKINAYLKYNIKGYTRLEDGTIVKDILNKAELSEALRLNLIEPETNHESHHSTAANVISYIPKALDSATKLFVGLLSVAAVLDTANAFRMVNNSIPDNSDANNSDVALDRSKRAANDISYVHHVTLENNNCAMIGTVDHIPKSNNMYISQLSRTYLYAKCVNEPCDNQPFRSSKEGTEIDWGDALQSLEVKPYDHQTARIIFSHKPEGFDRSYKQNNLLTHKCNLPLSPRYQHLEKCEELESGKKYAEALIECDKSLEADPSFSQALNLKTKLGKLMAAVTTIEPSSSTSLIEEASTPTGNFTMAGNSTTTANTTTITERTTAPAEPSNAEFKDTATPRPTPPEQTTNQGWSVGDLYKAVLSGMFAVAVVGGIVTVVCKKGSAIYHKCFNGSQDIPSYIGETMLFLAKTSPVQNLSTIMESAGDIAEEDAVSTMGDVSV